MQDKQNESRFGTLLRKIERKFNPFGRHLNIADKDKMARMVNDAESDEVLEVVRSVQFHINGEIHFRVRQPMDSITRFERNNLIVSLSDTENLHAKEIFEPFEEKGYHVVSLRDYEPFSDYHVYLVSWK